MASKYSRVSVYVYSLLSKLMDVVSVPKAWNEVSPEEDKHSEQLVQGAPEKEIEHVHVPCVLQTLLFYYIHQSCWNLNMCVYVYSIVLERKCADLFTRTLHFCMHM